MLNNNGFRWVLILVVMKLNTNTILAAKFIGSSFVSAQSEKLEKNICVSIIP